MNYRQQYTIEKVREQIGTIKAMLNDVMNNSGPLTADELKKVREANYHISQADDYLS